MANYQFFLPLLKSDIYYLEYWQQYSNIYYPFSYWGSGSKYWFSYQTMREIRVIKDLHFLDLAQKPLNQVSEVSNFVKRDSFPLLKSKYNDDFYREVKSADKDNHLTELTNFIQQHGIIKSKVIDGQKDFYLNTESMREPSEISTKDKIKDGNHVEPIVAAYKRIKKTYSNPFFWAELIIKNLTKTEEQIIKKENKNKDIKILKEEILSKEHYDKNIIYINNVSLSKLLNDLYEENQLSLHKEGKDRLVTNPTLAVDKISSNKIIYVNNNLSLKKPIKQASRRGDNKVVYKSNKNLYSEYNTAVDKPIKYSYKEKVKSANSNIQGIILSNQNKSYEKDYIHRIKVNENKKYNRTIKTVVNDSVKSSFSKRNKNVYSDRITSATQNVNTIKEENISNIGTPNKNAVNTKLTSAIQNDKEIFSDEILSSFSIGKEIVKDFLDKHYEKIVNNIISNYSTSVQKPLKDIFYSSFNRTIRPNKNIANTKNIFASKEPHDLKAFTRYSAEKDDKQGKRVKETLNMRKNNKELKELQYSIIGKQHKETFSQSQHIMSKELKNGNLVFGLIYGRKSDKVFKKLKTEKLDKNSKQINFSILTATKRKDNILNTQYTKTFRKQAHNIKIIHSQKDFKKSLQDIYTKQTIKMSKKEKSIFADKVNSVTFNNKNINSFLDYSSEKMPNRDIFNNSINKGIKSNKQINNNKKNVYQSTKLNKDINNFLSVSKAFENNKSINQVFTTTIQSDNRKKATNTNNIFVQSVNYANLFKDYLKKASLVKTKKAGKINDKIVYHYEKNIKKNPNIKKVFLKRNFQQNLVISKGEKQNKNLSITNILYKSEHIKNTYKVVNSSYSNRSNKDINKFKNENYATKKDKTFNELRTFSYSKENKELSEHSKLYIFTGNKKDIFTNQQIKVIKDKKEINKIFNIVKDATIKDRDIKRLLKSKVTKIKKGINNDSFIGKVNKSKKKIFNNNAKKAVHENKILYRNKTLKELFINSSKINSMGFDKTIEHTKKGLKKFTNKMVSHSSEKLFIFPKYKEVIHSFAKGKITHTSKENIIDNNINRTNSIKKIYSKSKDRRKDSLKKVNKTSSTNKVKYSQKIEHEPSTISKWHTLSKVDYNKEEQQRNISIIKSTSSIQHMPVNMFKTKVSQAHITSKIKQQVAYSSVQRNKKKLEILESLYKANHVSRGSYLKTAKTILHTPLKLEQLKISGVTPVKNLFQETWKHNLEVAPVRAEFFKTMSDIQHAPRRIENTSCTHTVNRIHIGWKNNLRKFNKFKELYEVYIKDTIKTKNIYQSYKIRMTRKTKDIFKLPIRNSIRDLGRRYDLTNHFQAKKIFHTTRVNSMGVTHSLIEEKQKLEKYDKVVKTEQLSKLKQGIRFHKVTDREQDFEHFKNVRETDYIQNLKYFTSTKRVAQRREVEIVKTFKEVTQKNSVKQLKVDKLFRKPENKDVIKNNNIFIKNIKDPEVIVYQDDFVDKRTDITVETPHTPFMGKDVAILKTEKWLKWKDRFWFVKSLKPSDYKIVPREVPYNLSVFNVDPPKDYYKTEVTFEQYFKGPGTFILRIFDQYYNRLVTFSGEIYRDMYFAHDDIQVDIIYELQPVGYVLKWKITDLKPKEAWTKDRSIMTHLFLNHPPDEHGKTSTYGFAREYYNKVHPIPFGADMGTKEMPIPINIMVDFIQILFMIWAKLFNTYSGFTGYKAVMNILAIMYDWLISGSDINVGDESIDLRRDFWLREASEVRQLRQNNNFVFNKDEELDREYNQRANNWLGENIQDDTDIKVEKYDYNIKKDINNLGEDAYFNMIEQSDRDKLRKENKLESYQYYTRCYHWLRWEAESILEQCKTDINLRGNYWVEQLLYEMVDYLEIHHFDVIPMWEDLMKMDEQRNIFNDPTFDMEIVLTKIKGIRHRVIENRRND